MKGLKQGDLDRIEPGKPPTAPGRSIDKPDAAKSRRWTPRNRHDRPRGNLCGQAKKVRRVPTRGSYSLALAHDFTNCLDGRRNSGAEACLAAPPVDAPSDSLKLARLYESPELQYHGMGRASEVFDTPEAVGRTK